MCSCEQVDSAMGPALQAAFMVMTPMGGKLMLFQSAVPSLGAPLCRKQMPFALVMDFWLHCLMCSRAGVLSLPSQQLRQAASWLDVQSSRISEDLFSY